MGAAIKSHMSTLEDEDIERLRKIYKKMELKRRKLMLPGNLRELVSLAYQPPGRWNRVRRKNTV